MAEIVALWEKKETGYRVLSPAVGYYSLPPKNGSLLLGGSLIGKLQVLNTGFDLVLPESLSGRVVMDEELDRVLAVAYGQELFRLAAPQQLPEQAEGNLPAAALVSEGEQPEVEEGYVIKAVTTGIFYRKPSPDSPSYVVEGQQVTKGKILGLIEVMKTFNHVIFPGTEDSDTGRIKKIYVDDAQEVKLGQPLFLISKE